MLDIVGRFGAGLKPPSYHEIRETYLKKEVASTKQMLEEHKIWWKKKGCSILSNCWTDKKSRSICNFLVNSPKGMIFLASVDTSDISKISDKVFEMLDDIVEKVGEENVVQLVTNNAANYKAAGEMLMKKRKKIFWTPCAIHCIDLILEDFEKKLKIHNETIAKGRKITTYIYGRAHLISILRKFSKGKDLIRPGATCFVTSYLTLRCLTEHRVVLMRMFSSDLWKSSRFVNTKDGKEVEALVLDNRFWRSVIICLKAAWPLIKVLRLVDSDKPTMAFIYREMTLAKEKIRTNFSEVKKSYEPVWRIIDERWKFQMHRPLHAAAYYLNPRYHYSPDFKDDYEVKIGLYTCIERMVSDPLVKTKIDMQLGEFKTARGMFGLNIAIMGRESKDPADWWDSFGAQCPELQNFAIRILSLTCSSSGCERNWSVFEMVHIKRRNRLHQKKMNDLVFVMSNLKQREKNLQNTNTITFDDVSSDDEWIVEKDQVFDDINSESDDENDINESHGNRPNVEIYDVEVSSDGKKNLMDNEDLEFIGSLDGSSASGIGGDEALYDEDDDDEDSEKEDDDGLFNASIDDLF